MNVPAAVRSGVVAAATAASIAACSGGNPQPAIPGAAGAGFRPSRIASATRRFSAALTTPVSTGARSATWMRPARTRRRVYIADFVANRVAVLDGAGNLIGGIGGLTNPNGVFVDSSHDLWVANEYAGNVLEFARGATRPKAILADTGALPVDVTVCPNGTVFASNLYTGSSGPGGISVYANGKRRPTGALTYPGQGWNYFVTCDSENNVFTTLFLDANNTTGGVVEYPGGKQSGAMSLGVPLSFPGGIQIDAAGNLLVNDQQARMVTEYSEGGSPTGKSLTYGDGRNDWVQIATADGGRIVAGADAYLNQGTALFFPSGKPQRAYHVPYGPSGNMTIGIAFDVVHQ